MSVKQITINSGNPPTAVPPSQAISKSAGDTVRWHSSSSNWSVDFDGDSPFESSHFSSSNPDSGAIRANASEKSYSYTIQVNGESSDPSIIVEH